MNWDRVVQSLERSAEVEYEKADRAKLLGHKDVELVSTIVGSLLNDLASAFRAGAP